MSAVLEYKGMQSTRYKALMKAVHLTTGVFAVFTIALLAGKVDIEAWKVVTAVWATTINVGLVGYGLSEGMSKFAAAKNQGQ